MAKRSKANSAVSVRSKVEMLEKRRLLSTTSALDPTVAAAAGSVSGRRISQPATAGTDSSTSGATDAASSDATSTLVLPSDPLAAGAPTVDPTTTDTTVTLPTDPIAPISFDDGSGAATDPANLGGGGYAVCRSIR